MKKILICIPLLLTGCGGDNKGFLMPALYEKGIELCAVNGGLEYISEPDFDYTYETTGRYTSEYTGYVRHTGKIVCKNNLSSVVNFTSFDERYKGKQR